MLLHSSEVVKKVKELREMGKGGGGTHHHCAIINTKYTSILNIVCALGQSETKAENLKDK